jgi:hypothetical protein
LDVDLLPPQHLLVAAAGVARGVQLAAAVLVVVAGLW